MVARSEVNFLEDRRSLQLIEQVINPRKRVFVLHRHFVEIAMVDAYLETSVLLLHNKTCVPHGEKLGRINPLSGNSYSNI